MKWSKLSLNLRLRLVAFAIAMLIIAIVSFPVKYASADGGPLPICPPKCGRDCSVKTPGCGNGGYLTDSVIVIADGSDPMPLCRAKGCGPIKGK